MELRSCVEQVSVEGSMRSVLRHMVVQGQGHYHHEEILAIQVMIPLPTVWVALQRLKEEGLVKDMGCTWCLTEAGRREAEELRQPA